jgi:hypothetical protein
MPAGSDGPAGSDDRVPHVVLAHVSDLHAGTHLSPAAAALPADVAGTDPALTVLTGDLTLRARPAQLAAARALLDRLPAPRLVVIGNHDVPLLDLRSRLLHPYDRYRSAIDPDLDPVCDLPGLRVLGWGRRRAGGGSPGGCHVTRPTSSSTCSAPHLPERCGCSRCTTRLPSAGWPGWRAGSGWPPPSPGPASIWCWPGTRTFRRPAGWRSPARPAPAARIGWWK